VHDEVDALSMSDTDLQQRTRPRRINQYRQVTRLEDPDRVAVGVKHVFVEDPVLPGARQDRRIHSLKLP
jgi:hypothetical protein